MHVYIIMSLCIAVVVFIIINAVFFIGFCWSFVGRTCCCTSSNEFTTTDNCTELFLAEFKTNSLVPSFEEEIRTYGDVCAEICGKI